MPARCELKKIFLLSSLIFVVCCLFAIGMMRQPETRVVRNKKLPVGEERLPLLHGVHRYPFLLPFYNITHPLSILVRQPWYYNLETFLSNISVDTVSLVSADDSLLSLLLNWLSNFRLSTSSSLSEVLIVALDANIHKILLSKGFNSLFITNENIFLPATEQKQPTNLSAIWMKRVTVARIINYWGIHVTMLDLNALVLKDIMSLYKRYNSSDIIGSIGSNPIPLLHKWGFTVCMGAIFFRSTNGTEKFWDAIAKFGKEDQDDQDRVNHVLENLKVNWSQDEACVRDTAAGYPTQWCPFEGEASEGGFAITVLSQKMVCRHGCDFKHKLQNYYIWHYYNKEQKIASTGPTWRLKENWREIFEKCEFKREHLIDQITDMTRTSNIWGEP